MTCSPHRAARGARPPRRNLGALTMWDRWLRWANSQTREESRISC